MKQICLAATAAASFIAAPASATDFSFSGAFTQDDNVAFFDFTANGASTVNLRSYSYAGGTNVAGTTFVSGGFDPILTLYELATGTRVAFQDDGLGVPPDPVTGLRYDVNFSAALTAGTYRVALSQFNNFGGATLSDPFDRQGTGNFTSVSCASGAQAPFCDLAGGGVQRTGNWAFDILGVDTAVGPGPSPGVVPEPATWVMMLLGFGMVARAARYRRRPTKIVYA